MTDKLHASLGASGAHRWMNCPGSIRLSEGQPDESSIYARQGTAAHEVAEMCLKNGYSADRFKGQIITIGNDGFEVDDEMIEAVDCYLQFCRSLGAPSDPRFIEQRFDLTALVPGAFGTNDYAVIEVAAETLHVVDYKHGRGKAVEVAGNPQLRYYGLGGLIRFAQEYKIKRVVLHVVQPRAPHRDGPVRSWETTAIELLDWSSDLIEAAARTTEPEAPLVTGDWCQFCRAASICPEYRREALDAARAAFAEETPAQLTDEALGEIAAKADFIKDWVNAVMGEVARRLEAGLPVPGWKLVAKRATRKWQDADAAAKRMLARLGDEAFAHSLKSPAQIEKLLPKDERKLVDELCVKESSGHTVAPDTDSRSPVASATQFDLY